MPTRCHAQEQLVLGVDDVARKAHHGIGGAVEFSFSWQIFPTFDLKLKSYARPS